ncbi:MAG: hypothetical protein HQL36_06700, partial [Alphaproteobacteria bacterium]|nr:hypothetical protein [Alphaproteobacteria bacterium]
MVHVRRRILPPAPIEVAFDVAADIERYPEFIPGCIATRIEDRDGNAWRVGNVFRFGPAPIPFKTRAVLVRPHALDIEAVD